MREEIKTLQPPYVIQNDVNRYKLLHEGKLYAFTDDQAITKLLRLCGLDAPYHGCQLHILENTPAREYSTIGIGGESAIIELSEAFNKMWEHSYGRH